MRSVYWTRTKYSEHACMRRCRRSEVCLQPHSIDAPPPDSTNAAPNRGQRNQPSDATRRVALFVLVAGVGFLVWVLLDYANELSIADKLRGVLGIVVFSYAIANALIYYVRFTEDGIEQRSTFGRIRFYRYEDLESFQVTITDTRIYLLGGKKLTIKRFEGNRHRISEILEGHGVSRVD